MERDPENSAREASEPQHSDDHPARPTLRRIVLGIDFRAPSIDALRWTAHNFAPDSELILVHAIHHKAVGFPGIHPAPADSDVETEPTARARLGAIAAELLGNRAVRVEVREDRPAAALAYLAESTGADVIVLGPHGGRESIPGIGSTAERLIRMSPIPVLLVVHPPERPIQHLVVAADQVDLMSEVLRWADVFAHNGNARVTLAHVFDPRFRALEGWQAESVRPEAAELQHGYPGFGDYVQATEAWLSGLSRELTGSPRIELAIAVGEPGREIIALAQRTDADMIVMGRRGRWRRVPAVIGSTASTVLRGAPCPVLIVVDAPDARFDPWGVEE